MYHCRQSSRNYGFKEVKKHIRRYSRSIHTDEKGFSGGGKGILGKFSVHHTKHLVGISLHVPKHAHQLSSVSIASTSLLPRCKRLRGLRGRLRSLALLRSGNVAVKRYFRNRLAQTQLRLLGSAQCGHLPRMCPMEQDSLYCSTMPFSKPFPAQARRVLLQCL